MIYFVCWLFDHAGGILGTIFLGPPAFIVFYMAANETTGGLGNQR